MSTENPPTPEQRLSEIQERHGNATEGPWWFDESADTWRLHGGGKQILKAPKSGTPYAEYWPDEADGAFIVGAWEDMRFLLAEVDRLKARGETGQVAVARVRALHAEVSHRPGYCYCANPHPCPTIWTLDPDDEGGGPRD